MKPSTRRVLDRLRQGPATTHDLCQPDMGGGRFGARLGELRALGYVWQASPLGAGRYLYRLLAEPEPSPSPAPPTSGDVRHGAQGEPATAPRLADETADRPASQPPVTQADSFQLSLLDAA